MALTPVGIRTHEFKKVMRGFDPAEVRSFLEDVASEFAALQDIQSQADRRLIELETQLKDYHAVEKALQQTFMQAQETTGKAIENARREAQLIIQEAEVKSSQMLEKARTDLTTVKEQVTILKAKKDSIVSRLRMLLNSELELIKALDVNEELQMENEPPKEHSRERIEIEEILKTLDR
jgi:cell division initiation protein